MKSVPGSALLITNRLNTLGKMKKEEKRVLLVFGITAFCWIFQNLINSLFDGKVLNDTNIAMTGGILMFLYLLILNEVNFCWTGNTPNDFLMGY